MTGTLNSDFKGSAGLSFKDGAVMASPTLELGEGRWQIKVLTRALVWKHEASWDAVAWEKRTYPEKPFDVSILDVRSLATTVL
ncbi:MAG: hypothetical protein IPF99_34625 [Deltaproteobacteria bacterium]|nr:hypothetical protein [Deltaproteobacteria bacterium]